MRFVLLLFFLFGASQAFGKPSYVGPVYAPKVYTQSASYRDTRLCVLGDVQNMVHQVDAVTPFPGFLANCATVAGFGCEGGFCADSPYCEGTWENTGARLLNNVAYSMTGQYEKIDYTGLSGHDRIQTRLSNMLDHGRCDIIISLGDMNDIDDGRAGLTYDQLGDGEQRQLRITESFWTIIANSGIPFVPLQGNHDTDEFMVNLFASLGITQRSFYYATTPNGRGIAIKAPTPTGKDFCVIGYPWTTSAENTTWAIDNAGCGAGLPTILLWHNSIASNCAINNSPSGTVVQDNPVSEIFMAAGGHLTNTNFSCMEETTQLFDTDADASVWTLYLNAQEANRHSFGFGVTQGMGPTPSDSNGGVYAVVTIHPNASRICGKLWNPYWQVSDFTSNGQDGGSGATDFSQECWTFAFDTRFPP